MALSKIEDARNLSDQEIADEIAAVKRHLFELRFQRATRQLEKEFHRFKHARHRLAQLMTVERERQLAASAQSAESAASVSGSAAAVADED